MRFHPLLTTWSVIFIILFFSFDASVALKSTVRNNATYPSPLHVLVFKINIQRKKYPKPYC